MGWWGPGVFDGDQPLDLYADLLHHLGGRGVALEPVVMHPEGFPEVPGDLSQDAIDAAKGLGGLAEGVMSWVAEITDVTKLPKLPEGIAESVESLGLAPEDASRIADELLAQLRPLWTEERNSDARIGCQVAAAVLLGLQLQVPPALARLVEAACALDDFADQNPARRAALDELLAAVRQQDTGWAAPTRSLGEAMELAAESGQGIVNMPGSW